MRACDGVPTARFYTGDSPTEFVVSQNLHRRHLTPGQKAAVAASLEPMFAAEAKKRKVESGKQTGRGNKKVGAELRTPLRSHTRAAKATGTSGRAVSQYKRVAATAPDLAEKVKPPMRRHRNLYVPATRQRVG